MSVRKELTVHKERLHEYLVDEHGTKKEVIVPIEEYEEFQELLGELHDLEVILTREGEPAITLKELRERLEKDTLLRLCFKAAKHNVLRRHALFLFKRRSF